MIPERRILVYVAAMITGIILVMRYDAVRKLPQLIQSPKGRISECPITKPAVTLCCRAERYQHCLRGYRPSDHRSGLHCACRRAYEGGQVDHLSVRAIEAVWRVVA